MNKEQKLVVIGNYCKTFRTEILNLTLQEFEVLTGTNVKTISSFENGKSTNLVHVLRYLDLCGSNENRVKYLQGLNKVLGGL